MRAGKPATATKAGMLRRARMLTRATKTQNNECTWTAQTGVDSGARFAGKRFQPEKPARKFYIVYKDRISATVLRFFDDNPPFTLPWSHYILLMRIKDDNERRFYGLYLPDKKELQEKLNEWILGETKD